MSVFINYNYKPNHYYKRCFIQYKDDIIKVDSSGSGFHILWEVGNNKQWHYVKKEYHFAVNGMSVPSKIVEYNSLEDLMEEMFLELM